MTRELKTQKQALKEPLGTFYHPTKNTYRTGACEIGKVMKKGYKKQVNNKNIYIDPVCIKNKGKPGILIDKKNKNKIIEDKKMEKYIKEIHKTSYRSVIMKLYGDLRKKEISSTNMKNLEKDIEMLKKWRINNPNKTKDKKKDTARVTARVTAKDKTKDKKLNKKINKNLNNNNKKDNIKALNKKNLFKNNNIHNEKLFKSSLKEFQKNLETDFLPEHKKNKSNNKIKELSTKEILNLIKND